MGDLVWFNVPEVNTGDFFWGTDAHTRTIYLKWTTMLNTQADKIITSIEVSNELLTELPVLTHYFACRAKISTTAVLQNSFVSNS